MAFKPHLYESEQTGSEFIHLMEGSLLVTLKGRTERLSEGDSAYFKDFFPSYWKNEGGEAAKLIVVAEILRLEYLN